MERLQSSWREEGYARLSDEEKKKLAKLLVKKLRNVNFVEGAILFGSFVRGNHFRDIDVVVIAKKKVRGKNLGTEGRPRRDPRL